MIFFGNSVYSEQTWSKQAEWATSYQLQIPSEKRPDNSGVSCWEKNYFKHKTIQLFFSHCLKKTHSHKRMGHKSLFQCNFFLDCSESFHCSWNLYSLLSFVQLTFKRDWKHADKEWRSQFICPQLRGVSPLVIRALVLSKEGEGYAVSGFHGFLPLAMTAAFHYQKHKCDQKAY